MVSYDHAGNLIDDEKDYAMAYGAYNHMERIYDAMDTNGVYNPGVDVAVGEYDYDALGRRIKFVNHFDDSGIYGSGPTEVTTLYLYDGRNVIAEYNTNGAAALLRSWEQLRRRTGGDAR